MEIPLITNASGSWAESDNRKVEVFANQPNSKLPTRTIHETCNNNETYMRSGYKYKHKIARGTDEISPRLLKELCCNKHVR